MKKKINRVLIEGIGLKQEYLIDILKCLQVNGPNGMIKSSVRILSMGNVSVSPKLMNFIFDTMFPSLYSFDIFNIKCIEGLKEW